ncbi:MAG: DNRLRE domain-containing protein, partial [Candidatus Thermoplasmatota archaeon]|nr:DNRLRE domain-containing protein [Candidatus Thermoplasmatota archaeon]MBU1940556.1 DNRLRE domain-containing protein [Candidatus Thermoplasmatota archaeon]
IFIPPVQSYGIFGYALYCSVDADDIKPWPPNYPPSIQAISPPHQGTNILLSTTELTFRIEDTNDDLMSYSVTTLPDIGGGNENTVESGEYSIPITGLEGTQAYEWTVTVTDGENTVAEIFRFTTEPVAPEVANPQPKHGERYIAINTSELQFHLSDPQEDLMDYTVETSPDIGSGSGSHMPEGTYSIPISGLTYSTIYTWYINVTDGEHPKHETFCFTTIPEGIIILYPTDDTRIVVGVPNNNYGASTATSVRNEGSGGNWEWDPLIRFDLSSAPSNITILNAYINLYYYKKKDNNPAGHDLTLYRITSDWDEMTVTWNTQPTYAPTPTTYATVPSAPSVWMSWDVTNDILNYQSGIYTNYGWKIMDEHYWGGANIPITYFYTKENGDSIPYLEIQY